MRQDGHDGMVVRQHNNQESHTDGIIVRHGQVNTVKATTRSRKYIYMPVPRKQVMRA